MKTANSLSGGKTSSYLAVHFPADYEIFALVCIDSHNAGSRIDKSMKKAVNDKLQKHSSHWPEFVATSEDPKILKAMFDLEQRLGREVIWLRGMGWEQMIKTRKAIPNVDMRFCTTMLKMQPIFEYLYLYEKLPVKMRLGYRYDESERKDKATTDFKFASRTDFRPKSMTHINRWESMEWRENEFPLIDNKVFHHDVLKFWDDKEIIFPIDSNCQNCFWKQPEQLRQNFDTNPDIMYWAGIQEDIQGNTFRKDLSLLQIKELGLQLDFNFGTGSGCQAGFCTD